VVYETCISHSVGARRLDSACDVMHKDLCLSLVQALSPFQIKVEAVHPVVYDEYINIYYRQNTTIAIALP
jgi:hypothetical protein